jgi:hypothetical protein
MDRTIRVILVLLAALYGAYYAQTGSEWHFIDNVDLIFHEAGHTIFFWTGEWLRILAGSAFQVALPFFIAVYFFLQKQKISGALTLLWVGMNVINVSIYAGDAVRMELPLLGGDGVIHDWNYLLSSLNLLSSTDTIATVLKFCGDACIFFGSLGALYLAWCDTPENSENREGKFPTL